MSGGIARVLPLAAVVVVMAGCTSDPAASPLPGGPGPGSASATTSAPAPATTPAAAVPATVVRIAPARPGPADAPLLEGYRRFWVGLAEAYRTGRTTGLLDATLDPARARFITRAATLRAAAQNQRGTVLGSPLVADLAAGIVVDCMDLRDFRTYDSRGKALFPRDPGTTRVRARLRSVGGRWKLSDFETEGSGCTR